MKKKLVQGLASASILFLTVGLSACSLGGDKTPASMEVTSGTYVLEQGKTLNANEGYLALNFSLKNTSGETMKYLSSSAFKLYDEKGNQLSTTSVYAGDGSDFQTLRSTDLSPDKTLKSSLVFQVDKGRNYELHFSPLENTNKKEKDLVVKVDTKKFEDPSKELIQLANAYIDQVFLGKKGVKSDLTNDLNQSHQAFNVLFAQKFEDSLSSIKSYYSPTDKELNAIVSSFEAANLKRGKVEVKIYEMFPDYAVVSVKPTLLSFNSLDLNDMMTEWVDKNRGKYSSFSEAMKASAQYMIQNLSKNFDTASLSTPSTGLSGGERLILKKESSGKWSVDEKDSTQNTDFKYLQSDFMGGLSNY